MSILISTYSWIFSMIILNHGIITVSSSLPFLTVLEEALEQEGTTMQDIALKIDDVEKTVMKSEESIIARLAHLYRNNRAISDFSRAAKYINRMFESFRTSAVDSDNTTLKNFAEQCISANSNRLIRKLDDLTETVSPTSKYTTSLFRLIIKPYRKAVSAAVRCDETQSLQQEVMSMYTEVVMYVIKGYAMLFEACKSLPESQPENYEKKKKSAKVNYKRTIRRITKSATSAMRVASRDLRTCDPTDHEEGKTYIELKWLFNGFLIPEEYLLKKWMYQQDICSKNCEFFKSVDFELSRHGQLDDSVKCSGDLYNCAHSRAQHYCVGTGSGRRYDYVTYSESMEKTCDQAVWVGSNFPQMDTMELCEFCRCACDDYNHPETLRKFSLALVEADISKNRVITGLRFVEINRVIHIQIQQGELEPNEVVKEETVEWLGVDVESVKDVWEVNWNQKTINLDTLVAPPDQVMTGIQFSVQNSTLRLTIRTHGYDHSAGVYLTEDEHWISNNITDREIIEIEESDAPFNAGKKNIVAVGEHLSVNFQMTDWNKNLSQTAIPLLDAQSVISDPPRALSGAGLYFRGQSGYGGFVGLKLVTYDYAEVLDRQLSKGGALETFGKSEKDEETKENLDSGTEKSKHTQKKGGKQGQKRGQKQTRSRKRSKKA